MDWLRHHLGTVNSGSSASALDSTSYFPLLSKSQRRSSSPAGYPAVKRSVSRVSLVSLIAVASGLALVLFHFGATSSTSLPPYSSGYEPPPPLPTTLPPPPFPFQVDPYSQHGYISFDEEGDPLGANWIPYGCPSSSPKSLNSDGKLGSQTAGNATTIVPPPPNWLHLVRLAAGLKDPITHKVVNEDLPKAERERIQHDALTKLEFMQDNSILVIGDSVDRNAVVHMSEQLSSQANEAAVHYENLTLKYSYEQSEWHYRTIPHYLHITPEPNTTNQLSFHIANCFMHGLDDMNIHKEYAEDWHKPGRFEERVTELCKPFADQLPYQPKMIMLHSGMWDLAFFGRTKKGKSKKGGNYEPLDKEEMRWWISRMQSVIRKVKKTWPDSEIVYRTLHRCSNARSLNSPSANPNNYFTDVRVAQIVDMQRYIARKENLRIFDFNRVWEGQQAHQDGIHPLLLPGGVIHGNAIIHYAYMAAMQQKYFPVVKKSGWEWRGWTTW